VPETCTACGGGLTPHLTDVRDPLTGETFAVARCSVCGLGHTLPQPADLDRYYTSSYYGNRHGFTARFCMRRRLKFVAAALPGSNTAGRLLDIGCGDGSFLLAAREAGWKVMGTELNPAPGRSAGLDVRESVEEIEQPGSFDCITMWHTLEHMRDVPAMLKQVSRLLGPEGRLVIAVPDWGGLQARMFRKHWLHIDVPRHLYHFDAAALGYCLGTAGFGVERRWHQELEYDLLGWSQSALNSLMPAHPNLFFNWLTGKKCSAGTLTRFAGILLGSLLTLLALPAQAAGTLIGRGGTLIVSARRNPHHHNRMET